MVQIAADTFLQQRLVCITLEGVRHQDRDVLFEIFIVEVIDECAFAGASRPEQQNRHAELGVRHLHGVNILQRDWFGGCGHLGYAGVRHSNWLTKIIVFSKDAEERLSEEFYGDAEEHGERPGCSRESIGASGECEV